MASKKNSIPQRIDPVFLEEMKTIAKIRLDKGLAKFNPRDLSMVEMTKLLRRTQGYQMSLNELKIKPKRENLWKKRYVLDAEER